MPLKYSCLYPKIWTVPNLIREASHCSRWWLMRKPITVQSADSNWKRSSWPLNGTAVSLPPSQRRKGGKNVRARRWGDSQGKIVSGHDTAWVHMASLQLWLSTQDLHEIEPTRFSSMTEEGPMWPHHPWWTMGRYSCWGMGTIFL